MPKFKIVPSHRCNLNCKYCNKSAVGMSKRTIFSTENFLDIIEGAYQAGKRKIYFGGGAFGEPLMNKDLEKMIEKSRSIGFEKITLVSNGVLLKKRLDSVINAGLTNLSISLDTLNPQLYQRLCGVDHFDDVIEVINKASALVKMKINMVVLKYINESEIFPMLNFANNISARIQYGELIHDDSPDDKFFEDHYLCLDYLADIFEKFAERIEIQKVEKRRIYNIDKARVEIKSVRTFNDFTLKQNVPIVRPDGKIIFMSHRNIILDLSERMPIDRTNLSNELLSAFKNKYNNFDFQELYKMATAGTCSMAGW